MPQIKSDSAVPGESLFTHSENTSEATKASIRP